MASDRQTGLALPCLGLAISKAPDVCGLMPMTVTLCDSVCCFTWSVDSQHMHTCNKHVSWEEAGHPLPLPACRD